MRYFAFSDVHGDYDALMTALQENGYEPTNENHILISCGDNFGRAERGKGSKGIYEYLTSSIHRNSPVCIMGNHELLLKNILLRRHLAVEDLMNGEGKTVRSFLDLPVEDDRDLTAYDIDIVSKSSLLTFLLTRPYYYETKKHIFVHGFLPYDFEKKTFLNDFTIASKWDWERACWADTPSMLARFAVEYPSGFVTSDGKEKTIVFGHWDNASLRMRTSTEADDEELDALWLYPPLRIVGLDGCTFDSHHVPVYVFDEE